MSKVIDCIEKIDRVPVSLPDDPQSELRQELLDKAKTMFGYKAHGGLIGGKLAEALAELSISYYRTDHVKSYMKSKQGSFTFRWTFLITPAALLFWPFCGWMIVNYLHTSVYKFVGNYQASTAFLGVLFVLTAIVAAETATEWPIYRRVWKWTKYPLGRLPGYYPRAVPLFALNLAVQIKESRPHAIFFVHELSVDAGNTWPDPLPDPFLEVCEDGESYFIAAWDERDFEREVRLHG